MTTPMMQQYRDAKARHPGVLLFFRNGDFYELFEEDAELGSRLLGITLTKRDKEIPMAGVPHHALDRELGRLAPSECLCAEGDPGRLTDRLRDAAPAMALTPRPDWNFDPASARAALSHHFGVTTLAGFGFEDEQPCLVAAGALVLYLQE